MHLDTPGRWGVRTHDNMIRNYANETMVNKKVQSDVLKLTACCGNTHTLSSQPEARSITVRSKKISGMLPDVHFSNSVFIPSHQPALLFLASGPCLRWREVTNDVAEQKASYPVFPNLCGKTRLDRTEPWPQHWLRARSYSGSFYECLKHLLNVIGTFKNHMSFK